MLPGLFGGSNAGKKEMKEANKIIRDNVARLEAIGVPTVEAQRIALETPELVGLLEAEQYGPSAIEQVSVDPRLKQAQMSALAQMAGLAETGLGVEDKIAFDQLQREAGQAAQAQQASVIQDMAQRGMSDSGASLIAQLGAGQSQADRLSQGGARLASQAAQARREALAQQANMASNIRTQDYGQGMDLARARDAIAQFNAQNRQNVNAQNLTARQSIENQRAATANRQEMYNKELIQQRFRNELDKATGVNNSYTNLANSLSAQAAAKAQGAAAQTQGLMALGGAAIGGLAGGGLTGAAIGANLGSAVAGGGTQGFTNAANIYANSQNRTQQPTQKQTYSIPGAEDVDALNSKSPYKSYGEA